MAGIKLDIVTAERVVFSQEVDTVLIPGVEGELGVLPHHTPLMTSLEPGEILARRGGEEFSLAVTGGFVEIRPDRVIVLADAAERAEEINVERAEAAKRQAQENLHKHLPETDAIQAEGALLRSLARIRVAEKSKRRKGQLR